MRISKSALVIGLLTAVTVSAARADVIVGTLAFGGSGQFWSPDSITTPGTFSYSDPDNIDTATFSGNTLTITDQVLVNANSWQMTFTDATHPFTSLTLVSSDFSPTITDNLSAHTITVDWAGTLTPGTETAVFSFTNAVPEPSTWAMMLLGFAGLGFVGYRQAKKKGASFAPA
jgi:hypothetical protein